MADLAGHLRGTDADRPPLLEMLRFYAFAGAAVVLAVLFVVLTVVDAVR